jgi:hypothetical protein
MADMRAATKKNGTWPLLPAATPRKQENKKAQAQKPMLPSKVRKKAGAQKKKQEDHEANNKTFMRAHLHAVLDIFGVK